MLMLFLNMPILFSNSVINRFCVDLQILFSQSTLNPHCKGNTVLQSMEGRNWKIEWSTPLKDWPLYLAGKREKHSTLKNETSTNTKW